MNQHSEWTAPGHQGLYCWVGLRWRGGNGSRKVCGGKDWSPYVGWQALVATTCGLFQGLYEIMCRVLEKREICMLNIL